MRFWPFKKWDCTERGHQWQVEKRKGYAISYGPGHRRCVADWVEQERDVCRKCDQAEDWKTTHSTCLQGTNMPTSMQTQLDKEGFVRA